jgi:hypothetical protein
MMSFFFLSFFLLGHDMKKVMDHSDEVYKVFFHMGSWCLVWLLVRKQEWCWILDVVRGA